MNYDETLMQFHHKARDLFQQGDLQTAENYFHYLMEELETNHREFSLIYTSALSYVGKIRHETGRLQEALPHLERALETDGMLLGPEDKRLAHRHGTLALLLQDLGRYSEAESHLVHALRIAEKTFDPADDTIDALYENFRNLRKRMHD